MSTAMLRCFSVLLLSLSTADVLATSSHSDKCVDPGYIILYQGDQELKITEDVEDLEVDMIVDKVKLVRCEDCFRLYEKKNEGGRDHFVTRGGEQTIPLGKVRSVYKESCSKWTLPDWALIIIILILMLIFGTFFVWLVLLN